MMIRMRMPSVTVSRRTRRGGGARGAPISGGDVGSVSGVTHGSSVVVRGSEGGVSPPAHSFAIVLRIGDAGITITPDTASVTTPAMAFPVTVITVPRGVNPST